MKPHYKKVCEINTFLGDHLFAVKIDVDAGRELLHEEKWEIRQMCDQVIQLFRKNTLLADPKYLIELAKEKEDLLNCFSQPIYAKEIPNGYDSTLLNPWFIVTTPKGTIQIGWRKRVIVINWEASDITTYAEDLFSEENVTKCDFLIHAWGYDKAKEYLQKLLN